MYKSFNLSGQGLRLYAGRLYNHDFLWFSSTEISRISATEPVIHNYALSYSVSRYSYGIFCGNTPRYQDDLASMPAYATPAKSIRIVNRTRLTQNAVNSVTLRTGEKKVLSHLRNINTPDIGWRVVIDPIWQSNDLETGFVFYLFATSDFRPPAVTRLGKKSCPIRFQWEEISPAQAVFMENTVQPTHAINPLDISGKILSYEPVSIPPHLVLRSAEISGDWFVFAGPPPYTCSQENHPGVGSVEMLVKEFRLADKKTSRLENTALSAPNIHVGQVESTLLFSSYC
ncbi:MAG: type I-D CRISPR-associated protein Cas5/Csc1 [bacterium]